MISRFIEDINKSLKSHVKATVFLLARTETAQFIASYCTDNSIPISHYEIGFFDEQSSKEFIVKSISENDNSTIPDEECADKYYNLVKSNITDKESKSFLGYAPVLQAKLMEMIEQVRAEQKEREKKCGDLWHNSDRLFVNWCGKPANPNYPYVWLKKFCEKEGVPFHGLHSFRHFVATQALADGVDVKSVSAMLGHSQTSTTLNIYAHAVQQANEKALNSVAALLETV